MVLLRGLLNLSCWNPGIVDAIQYCTAFCSAQIDWLIDFLQSCNWMDWIDWWPASSMMQISQIQAACFSSSIKQPYKSWMQQGDLCTCVSALYKDNGLGGGLGGGGGGCWFGYHDIVEHFYKVYKFVWKSNVSLNELDFILRIIEFSMTEKNTVPMTDFQHKIICNRSSWEKREFYWYLSKMLRVENHWIIITNAQHRMYFAYSSSNFWNCGKLSLKLPNLLFLK
jgi:hypothetical protein